MPPSEVPAERLAILRNECPRCGNRMKWSREKLPNGEHMRKCKRCNLSAHASDEGGHSVHYRETQKERNARLDSAREGLMTESDWDEIRRILFPSDRRIDGPGRIEIR